jgi:hypothetical protein
MSCHPVHKPFVLACPQSLHFHGEPAAEKNPARQKEMGYMVILYVLGLPHAFYIGYMSRYAETAVLHVWPRQAVGSVTSVWGTVDFRSHHVREYATVFSGGF